MDCTEVYAVAVQEREIEDDEYLKDGFEGVIVNLENIDSKIAENLNGWSMSRLSKATLAVLRVAVYEMLYREDIPFNVSINEAVELAKKYDDDGILTRAQDGIARCELYINQQKEREC